MQKVVISSNLNPPLKLYFYSPILTNNNMLLKIYFENIVIKFLNCHFFFFILFFLSSFLSSICFLFFSFFFSLDFSPPHTYTHISPSSPFSFFYKFPLDSKTLFSSLCDQKRRKRQKEKEQMGQMAPLCRHHSSSSPMQPGWQMACVFFSFSFFFFFFCYGLINFKIMFLNFYFDYA